MAVSKSTRRPYSNTRQQFQAIFRKSTISEERRRARDRATAHLDDGPPVLRFPLYEHLYSLNLYAQKLVDVMAEIGAKLDLPPENALYHQHLIQHCRASVTSDVLDHMFDIEHTEEWLFESLRRVEEKKLRDPDDVYLSVREREAERMRAGDPPRIRFLDEKPAKEASRAKSGSAPGPPPARATREAKEKGHG
jgi:hypothetical protein